MAFGQCCPKADCLTIPADSSGPWRAERGLCEVEAIRRAVRRRVAGVQRGKAKRGFAELDKADK
jgi:hypothetical protein